MRSGKFADELDCLGVNFVRSCGRIEIEERFDVSAHSSKIIELDALFQAVGPISHNASHFYKHIFGTCTRSFQYFETVIGGVDKV